MASERPASIDIVVTAHNMQDCLVECLSSLAEQTFPTFRVIVVEDGSTDNTPAIADRFAEGDARFCVVHTSGLLAAGARNRGMELVEAPYFMLLDGDDVFHPTLLEKLMSAAKRTNADLVVCDIEEFDHTTGTRSDAPWALKTSQLPNLTTQPAFSWREVPGNVFAAFMGWPWDKLYRTAFVRDAHLTFPEDMANSEDMLFTYQAVVLAERIAVVDEVLIDHRIGRGNSVSNSRTAQPLAFYDGICQMKRFLRELPDGAWNTLRQDFLNWAFDWTLWNIETLPNGETKEGLTVQLCGDGFAELELASHEPSYFTGYPRSMARYASLLTDVLGDGADVDAGPLGGLDDLPYGKFKPWSKANAFEKLAIRARTKRNKPVEW